MKKITLGILSAAFALIFSASAALTPVDLRCDYAVNPLGVDSQNPRLFWKLAGGERGARQTAYQIVASASGKDLPPGKWGWDSGQVASDETIQIPFPAFSAGNLPAGNLKSSEQVFWKVRVWDEHGNVSKWSQTATWTMGILNAADWAGASWIGAVDTNIPSLLLRREFTVKSRSQLKRALVNVCGLGQYELTINGKKVGDDFLSPGWTKYNQTCLYDTRDITADLQAGKNAIGIELGNGMYNVLGGGRFTKFKGSFGPQKAIAQIRLEYEDGRTESFGTDENWRVAPGPVTFSSIYGGEDFDARRVQKNWDQPDFDDAQWTPALVVNGPGGELHGLSCAAPPIHEFEIHQPVATHTLTNGDIVFDLGQNAAHVPKISVTGPAGAKVQLLPSELLGGDGAINQGSMGAGRRGAVWCEYTKATDGVETWSPKFFYVGCRYVQAHFTPAVTNGALPKIKSLAGIVVQSSSDPVGEFACSNTLFNRIRNLVRWAQRSNMVSLLTDCPHRERLGWLEEDHLNGPALRYEFDLAQLFTKTINDISDSQLTNGLVPTTAPEYTIFRDKNDPDHLRNMFGDSPEWSSSFILVPWQQYEFDGDLNLFRLHYAAMTNYLAYFGTRTTDHIANFGLGDWYDVGPKHPGVSQLTPIALTATAFYFQDVAIMARVATLLGKNDDAGRFSGLAEKIRAAFNEKFFDATNHFYATDSQCANAIPLVMGLCEPDRRAGVVAAIVRDVRSRGNALTAGDVGYRYLLHALADGGRSDVIFDINNQSDKPGYGMQLAKGKTSLTEAWDGGSSQDHFMLGQIQEWFYHDLAGIRSDGDGFKKISLNPQPVGDVTWVKAGYNSIRGKIVSDWKRDGGAFTLKAAIPANTTATVFMPAKAAGDVTEGGRPAAQSPGVQFLRMENDRAVFAVAAGEYEFKSP
jgi:alpha-L-rhamnosidase